MFLKELFFFIYREIMMLVNICGVLVYVLMYFWIFVELDKEMQDFFFFFFIVSQFFVGGKKGGKFVFFVVFLIKGKVFVFSIQVIISFEVMSDLKKVIEVRFRLYFVIF